MAQAVDGALAIKADPRNLPKPSGMIEAERKDATALHLYAAYTQRAQYPLWVRDGVRAMMGLVARQVPAIELPSRLAYIEANATADGFSLQQLFVRVVREVLTYGRVALVVDADDAGRAFIALYPAASAINWKTRKVQGRDDLVLAVFAEEKPKATVDEFSHDVEVVYRVLDLPDGRLRVRVMGSTGGAIEERNPLTANARTDALGYLPVVYCGATDSTPDIDDVPLLAMAQAALVAYQLSADYYTALHQTSHAQPWVSGLDDSVELSVTGPSAAWDLGANGSCGYLEFEGRGIEAVRQAMADQKNASSEAGARVMDMGGVESGEARKTRQSDQHASLHSVVMIAAEAIEQCLRYAADWEGIPDTEAVKFTVVPEFTQPQADPQVLQQLQGAVIAGGVSWQTYWDALTTGKLPERSYEDEQALIEAAGPALGSLADD
jgi:hypothetical protein